MGAIVQRVVNPNTYVFIQSIASRFDQIKFGGTSVPTLIPNPDKRGIKWPAQSEYDTVARQWRQLAVERAEVLSYHGIHQNMAQALPPEMISEIAKHAENFSQWVNILGMTHPEVKVDPAVLDASAKSLLDRLKICPDASQPPHQQLLTYVFTTVFKDSTKDDKTKLIERMEECSNVLSSYSFKLRFTIFKIQVAIAHFFSYLIVRVIVALIVAWQSVRLYWMAKAFFEHSFRVYYLPKAVNIFINYAPAQAVPIVARIAAVAQYVVRHQFQTWIICSIGVACVGSSLRPYAKKIQAVVLFPSKFRLMYIRSAGMFIKNFIKSEKIQRRLAESAKSMGEGQQQQMVKERAPKAYQLWMYLMTHPEALYTKEIRSS